MTSRVEIPVTHEQGPQPGRLSEALYTSLVTLGAVASIAAMATPQPRRNFRQVASEKILDNQSNPAPTYDPLKNWQSSNRRRKLGPTQGRRFAGDLLPEKSVPLNGPDTATSAAENRAAMQANLRRDRQDRKRMEIEKYERLYGEDIGDPSSVQDVLDNGNFTPGAGYRMKRAHKKVVRAERQLGSDQFYLESLADGEDLLRASHPHTAVVVDSLNEDGIRATVAKGADAADDALFNAGEKVVSGWNAYWRAWGDATPGRIVRAIRDARD